MAVLPPRCSGTSDATLKALGAGNGTNECNNQPTRTHTQQYTLLGGGRDSRRSIGGEGGRTKKRRKKTRTTTRRGSPRVLHFLVLKKGDGGDDMSFFPYLSDLVGLNNKLGEIRGRGAGSTNKTDM